MPSVINFKICDNASACSGISACPTQAITYDEKQKTLVIDLEKCVSCGACEKACKIGAIGCARTKEEFEELLTEIENDPRKKSDLFVDRYGSDLVNPKIQIDESEIIKTIKENQNGIIELYDPNIAECLLKSIPITTLLKRSGLDFYNKCSVSGNYEKLNVSTLPALVVYKNREIYKIIEGYFEEKQLPELEELMK